MPFELEMPPARARDRAYGVLFPDLPAWGPPRGSAGPHGAVPRELELAAERLIEASDADASRDGTIPAGYTYFGQFLTHDLSFRSFGDPAGARSIARAQNLRTARFDLDSLYGNGPQGDPQLYRRDRPAEFLIGGLSDPRGARGAVDDDLPRSPEGLALIPDPRNDDNVLLSQIHLAFLKAHNAIVKQLEAKRGGIGPGGDGALWAEAKQLLSWHYQWLVFHDFLPRVLDAPSRGWLAGALAACREAKGRLPAWAGFRSLDFLPAEVVLAVLRFGHSMVRPSYALNPLVRTPVRFHPENWMEAPDAHLAGRHRLVDDWTVDWRFFFEDPRTAEDESLPPGLPQRARRIDRKLAAALANLPPGAPRSNLALLTLERGWLEGLPSGQDVARELGIEADRPQESTPLWEYVLLEAESRPGDALGPVASKLLAEVLFGILLETPNSYLSATSEWTPTLAGRSDRYEVCDLLSLGWPEPRTRPVSTRRVRRRSAASASGEEREPERELQPKPPPPSGGSKPGSGASKKGTPKPRGSKPKS